MKKGGDTGRIGERQEEKKGGEKEREERKREKKKQLGRDRKRA